LQRNRFRVSTREPLTGVHRVTRTSCRASLSRIEYLLDRQLPQKSHGGGVDLGGRILTCEFPLMEQTEDFTATRTMPAISGPKGTWSAPRAAFDSRRDTISRTKTCVIFRAAISPKVFNAECCTDNSSIASTGCILANNYDTRIRSLIDSLVKINRFAHLARSSLLLR
jgi:hypothetical protein